MKSCQHVNVRNHQAKASVPFKVSTIESAMQDDAEELCRLAGNDDSFKLIWITAGTVSYQRDRQGGEVQVNCIYCIKPSQADLPYVHAGAKGFIISFTEDFLNISELEFFLACQTGVMQLFSRANGMLIRDAFLAEMQETVFRMLKESESMYRFRTEMLKRYLKIFLMYLVRQFEESFQPVVQTRNMEIVQKFTSLLEKNFKVNKMVSDYACSLCVTPNYLNEIVKKVTGYSAGYHIRQRIAREAKRKALYSDSSMKEIAYDLGFLDCGHFSKFFKSITGANFSSFKRERTAVPVAV